MAERQLFIICETLGHARPLYVALYVFLRIAAPDTIFKDRAVTRQAAAFAANRALGGICP